MNKKVNALGVEIDYMSAADALEKTAAFLQTEPLNTIELMNTRMLLEAGKDEIYRDLIEQLDMTVIADKKILEAVGITDEDLGKEIEHSRYIKGVFRRADYDGTVFVLLCSTADEKETLSAYLNKKFPGIKVEAAFSLADMREDTDSLVNDINGHSPEIVLSTLNIPTQELFLAEVKSKLNARVWLGAGEILKTSGILESRSGFLGKMIENHIFKKKMEEYQQEKGDS